MRRNEKVRLALGGVLLAVVLLALMAAPGLVSDRDSTVPSRLARESSR